MSDNWAVQKLENALNTWNDKLAETWQLNTQSTENFKGGTKWTVVVDIHAAVQAIGLALLVLFLKFSGDWVMSCHISANFSFQVFRAFSRFCTTQLSDTDYSLPSTNSLFLAFSNLLSTLILCM